MDSVELIASILKICGSTRSQKGFLKATQSLLDHESASFRLIHWISESLSLTSRPAAIRSSLITAIINSPLSGSVQVAVHLSKLVPLSHENKAMYECFVQSEEQRADYLCEMMMLELEFFQPAISVFPVPFKSLIFRKCIHNHGENTNSNREYLIGEVLKDNEIEASGIVSNLSNLTLFLSTFGLNSMKNLAVLKQLKAINLGVGSIDELIGLLKTVFTELLNVSVLAVFDIIDICSLSKVEVDQLIYALESVKFLPYLLITYYHYKASPIVDMIDLNSDHIAYYYFESLEIIDLLSNVDFLEPQWSSINPCSCSTAMYAHNRKYSTQHANIFDDRLKVHNLNNRLGSFFILLDGYVVQTTFIDILLNPKDSRDAFYVEGEDVVPLFRDSVEIPNDLLIDLFIYNGSALALGNFTAKHKDITREWIHRRRLIKDGLFETMDEFIPNWRKEKLGELFIPLYESCKTLERAELADNQFYERNRRLSLEIYMRYKTIGSTIIKFEGKDELEYFWDILKSSPVFDLSDDDIFDLILNLSEAFAPILMDRSLPADWMEPALLGEIVKCIGDTFLDISLLLKIVDGLMAAFNFPRYFLKSLMKSSQGYSLEDDYHLLKQSVDQTYVENDDFIQAVIRKANGHREFAQILSIFDLKKEHHLLLLDTILMKNIYECSVSHLLALIPPDALTEYFGNQENLSKIPEIFCTSQYNEQIIEALNNFDSSALYNFCSTMPRLVAAMRYFARRQTLDEKELIIRLSRGRMNLSREEFSQIFTKQHVNIDETDFKPLFAYYNPKGVTNQLIYEYFKMKEYTLGKCVYGLCSMDEFVQAVSQGKSIIKEDTVKQRIVVILDTFLNDPSHRPSLIAKLCLHSNLYSYLAKVNWKFADVVSILQLGNVQEILEAMNFVKVLDAKVTPKLEVWLWEHDPTRNIRHKAISYLASHGKVEFVENMNDFIIAMRSAMPTRFFSEEQFLSCFEHCNSQILIHHAKWIFVPRVSAVKIDPTLVLKAGSFEGAHDVLLEYFKYKQYLPGMCALGACTAEQYDEVTLQYSDLLSKYPELDAQIKTHHK